MKESTNYDDRFLPLFAECLNSVPPGRRKAARCRGTEGIDQFALGQATATRLGSSRTTKPSILLMVVAVAVSAMVGVGPTRAGASDDGVEPARSRFSSGVDPIVEGRTALRRAARFPWYDRTEDTVRPIDLPKPRAESNRSWNIDWLRPMVWFLLAIVLILIAAAAWVGWQRRGVVASEQRHSVRSADVRFLGILEDVAADDFLSRCLQERDAGRFERAVIFLYAHVLTECDRRQLLRLAKGKTNRQYLRELADPKLRRAVAEIVAAFEDVYFGARRIERDRFEHCYRHWRSMQSMFEIDHTVSQADVVSGTV